MKEKTTKEFQLKVKNSKIYQALPTEKNHKYCQMPQNRNQFQEAINGQEW